MTGDQDDSLLSPQQKLAQALEAEQHYPPYRFVLLHGTEFEPAPLPAGVEPGKPKCCFANAFRLASERPDLRYVEGFGTQRDGPNWPLDHAWCIDESGNVIDPTWHTPRLRALALRGVVLPLDLVEPYASDFSRGTFDAMRDHVDVIARRLGIEEDW